MDRSKSSLTRPSDHCVGFTDFVSFYLQYTNLYNFVFVTKDWDVRYMSYFAYTQTIALTVFGIMAGAIMSYTRDVKVSHDRGSMGYVPRISPLMTLRWFLALVVDLVHRIADPSRWCRDDAALAWCQRLDRRAGHQPSLARYGRRVCRYLYPGRRSVPGTPRQ
jgi:hypothetical protein